jgi:hypothetical protein
MAGWAAFLLTSFIFLNLFASYLAAHFQEKITEGFGEDLLTDFKT